MIEAAKAALRSPIRNKPHINCKHFDYDGIVDACIWLDNLFWCVLPEGWEASGFSASGHRGDDVRPSIDKTRLYRQSVGLMQDEDRTACGLLSSREAQARLALHFSFTLFASVCRICQDSDATHFYEIEGLPHG